MIRMNFHQKQLRAFFNVVKQRPLSILLSILILVLLPSNLQPSIAFPVADNLQALSLDKYQRILVFAPHNDDETLGAAGVIQLARQNGASVHVVIATNGDGSLSTALSEFRKVYPASKDFIWIGNIRQQESLAALQDLGLAADDVDFLSYPDRGTSYLWENYWSCEHPFHSPFTNSTYSHYLITYDRDAKYCGNDLFHDLKKIISDYQPDLILYPSVDDEHPDHWGLANFVNLTVQVLKLEDSGFDPGMYQYLVHRYGFPLPEGYYPNQALVPPPSLFDIDPNWVKVNLPEEAVSLKNEAVREYKSQLPTLKSLLISFIRQNELFALPQHPVIGEGQAPDRLDPQTWLDRQGNELAPLLLDPIKDNIRREYVSSGDIDRIYSVIVDRELVLCAQMRGIPRAYNTYTFRFRVYEHGEFDYNLLSTDRDGLAGKLKRKGNYVCGSMPLRDLGNPEILMLEFDAKTADLATIDRTAWAIVPMNQYP